MKTKIVVTVDHNSEVISSSYIKECVELALYEEFHDLDLDGLIGEDYEIGIMGVDIRHESSVE